MPDTPKKPQGFLRQTANWRELRFYRKADALYQMTFVFCQRFLPLIGDRTVDQMVQAARSGKQNIVEGSEDGMTSTEMEVKLLNVARSSIDELREDYSDYITKHHICRWGREHPRYQPMQDYTKSHNEFKDYQDFCEKWTVEEFCNTALTMCYQVDAMMNAYLKYLEKEFVSQGGIKERMYAARTGYRKEQDQRLLDLQKENERLRAENASLKKEKESLTASVEGWKAKYTDLKQRALKAYYDLKAQLDEAKRESPS